MRQITGNKLLVRALKEEGVDTIFGYPGACTIDISDELGRQDDIKIILPRHEQALVHEAETLRSSCRATSRRWSTRRMPMRGRPAKWACVW